MTFKDIEYRVEGHVAQVMTNRPSVRNAQSRRLLDELDAAFDRAAHDRDVRVIVLSGAGEHFCSGHDLGSREELADREARPREPGVRGLFGHSSEYFLEKTVRFRNLPKPTIAAVQGYCIFAGWMLASAMDIIFAADDALFLAMQFECFSMPWDLHPRKAKELLFESRFVDANEAAALGLVNRVVPRATLLEETLEYAQRVATNDPFQLRMMKLAVNQAQEQQGFTAHVTAAHVAHILTMQSTRDRDHALKQSSERRLAVVERAFAHLAAKRKRA